MPTVAVLPRSGSPSCLGSVNRCEQMNGAGGSSTMWVGGCVPFTGTSCNCPPLAPLNLCQEEGQPLIGSSLGSGFIPRRIPKGCLWEERALLWWMVRSPEGAPQAQRLQGPPYPAGSCCFVLLFRSRRDPSSAFERPRLPPWKVHPVGEGQA